MAHALELQLQIPGHPAAQDPVHPPKDATTTHQSPQPPPSSMLKHWKWWFMVALNIFFVVSGQTVATLLGRFYFNEGGNSKWMATIVQSAGFPLLLIPLLFFHSGPSTLANQPIIKLTLLFTILGLMVAADNLMYTYGLLYLPVSTYSLVCASQLAFNSVFSFFFNAQKFTHLIFNSVVLLTFSAALLGVQSDNTHVPGENYPLGFILTLAASATFSLILSLIELIFQKVIKTESFCVVLEMQFWISVVTTIATVVGLFASGEWRGLKSEMDGYETGRVSYVMTLVWTAVTWQVTAVGLIGLTFVVSSLFSNVISTVSLPVVPIFAVVLFRDKMDGVKVVSMLIAIWGFLSYIYQQYLDDVEIKKDRRDGKAISSTCTNP